MTRFRSTVSNKSYSFASLKNLLAKATPARSGDALGGVAVASDGERVVAQLALADVPLSCFLHHPIIPYEDDDVARLIPDMHDRQAFLPISQLTVGAFRDWLLRYETTGDVHTELASGLTLEMVTAVTKLMRNQDLVASKCRVVTRFRNTQVLAGRRAVRRESDLQIAADKSSKNAGGSGTLS